jgi:hypothetical protein
VRYGDAFAGVALEQVAATGVLSADDAVLS